MSSKEYKKGEIVWGKIRGHPWWPAQITRIIRKKGKSAKHNKYKCAYINDSSHSELWSSSMKPFREYYIELSKRKIRQKSLKDAIKIADQRDQDNLKGKLNAKSQFLSPIHFNNIGLIRSNVL